MMAPLFSLPCRYHSAQNQSAWKVNLNREDLQTTNKSGEKYWNEYLILFRQKREVN